MSKKLTAAEEKLVKYLVSRIELIKKVLLKSGGSVSLKCGIPPTSEAVKSAVIKKFEGELEVKFIPEGMFIRDLRVPVKKWKSGVIKVQHTLNLKSSLSQKKCPSVV